jgi:PhoH-like ATPase
LRNFELNSNRYIPKDKKLKKLKIARKTFILDTNVLLSDSESLRSFQENNVVLPLIVVEELDRHKDRQDDTGKNAREISRQLIDLVKNNSNDVKKGIKLGKGLGTLKILNQKDLETGVIISIPELDYSKGDNKIVQFCLEYKQKHTSEKVVLVTRDLLLRIKAISVGIDCEDYKKLSKEFLTSINMPATEEDFYSGVTRLTISENEMDHFYAKNSVFTLSEEQTRGLYPNQFVLLEENDSTTTGLCRFLETGKPVRKVPFQTEVWGVKTRNMEQAMYVDLLMDDSISLVMANSKSGCGKTLLSMAVALELVLAKKKYNKIMITSRILARNQNRKT